MLTSIELSCLRGISHPLRPLWFSFGFHVGKLQGPCIITIFPLRQFSNHFNLVSLTPSWALPLMSPPFCSSSFNYFLLKSFDVEVYGFQSLNASLVFLLFSEIDDVHNDLLHLDIWYDGSAAHWIPNGFNTEIHQWLSCCVSACFLSVSFWKQKLIKSFFFLLQMEVSWFGITILLF